VEKNYAHKVNCTMADKSHSSDYSAKKAKDNSPRKKNGKLEEEKE